MRPKVKICGITSYEDAIAASDFGAWALGFNFYEQSKRFISIKDATEIIKHLPSKIEKVGLFVNAPPDEVRIKAKMAGITMIQLHGLETPEVFTKFPPKRIIKAFRPENPDDILQIKKYEGLRYALIDANVKGEFGGTGAVANWSLAKMAKDFALVILAGGLKPSNVVEACKKVKPFAVDVTTGVESKPGIKDHEKLREFFLMVKQSVP